MRFRFIFIKKRNLIFVTLKTIIQKYRTIKLVLCILVITLTGQLIEAQNHSPTYKPPTTRILFIFDASLSMSGNWQSDQKINIARKILIHLIDSLEQISNVKMALRVYGHQSPVPIHDCNDTRLEVPFGVDNAPEIRQKLRYLSPKGTTPMTNSLTLAANDFPKDCPDCRNVIILITDGIEECGGDPCTASIELQKKGIALKPFIIGIGMDEGFSKSFDCIGQFFDAKNEEDFKEVLGVVVTQALNETTAQVNLLDKNGNPTETDVNMTFYDMVSGKVKHNFIHTINNKGNPDTLILDPLVTYRLVVNTLPQVIKENVKVYPGKHTIIGVDAPQGMLVVSTANTSQYRDLKFIVRQSGTMQTLNFQNANLSEKYIVGKYDLEVMTLPRLYLKEVDIKQSNTTTVDIPRPGIVTFLSMSTGYGSLYVLRNGTQEWVCNLNPALLNESVVLQPGSYRVVYRPKSSKRSLNTIVKTFEVVSGSSQAIQFY